MPPSHPQPSSSSVLFATPECAPLVKTGGLGDVSGAIKKVITPIQEKVDNAIDKMIEWIVEKAKAIFGAVLESFELR